ncbi:MAG: SPW repeat protein [Nocardioidaceae bacterium]
MKQWTRWQDWVAVVAGAYAMVSPIWTNTTNKATWTMIILGVLTAAAALGSLAVPDNNLTDGAVAVLGVLFILSPWVMGFSGTTAMAWTAWIVGAVSLVVGALAWPESNRLHRQHVAPTH